MNIKLPTSKTGLDYRVFLHVWSVNLKFLPEALFQSKALAVSLLVAHLSLLWLFAQNRWCKREGGILQTIQDFWHRSIDQVPGLHSPQSEIIARPAVVAYHESLRCNNFY